MFLRRLISRFFGPPKVGTFNGVDVFSNKKIQKIDNNLIIFDDGSTCDVATGKISNKGNGTVIVISSSTKGTTTNGTTSSKQVAYSNIDANSSITIASISQSSSITTVTDSE